MFWVVAGLLVVASGVAVALLPTDPDGGAAEPADPIGDGPISPERLRSMDLPLRRRGYDPAVVDVLLERLATQQESSPVRASGEELEERRGDLPRGLDR